MTIAPPPCEGLNLWTLSSARKVRNQGGTAHDAYRAIMGYQGTTRRPLKESEVWRAINRAFETDLAPVSVPKPAPPGWRKEKTAVATLRYEMESADLWERSPIRIDEGFSQLYCLRALFPDPQGLVCVGKSTFEFHTARIDQFRDLTQCAFIVPCYMTKRKGLTQDGKPSMHCLDNCGPRRFVVCDFDEPGADQHASIIWHLKDLAKLIMVVHSGKRSLHAWFQMPEDREPHFWEVALGFGADPALMRNRSSFVRMPQGTRDNGSRQLVFYFDEEGIKG